MNWNKQTKFLTIMIGYFVIHLLLMIISEFMQEWFSSSQGNCSWKGSDKEIYSSICYSETSYSDTKCLSDLSSCSCCNDATLVSVSDIEEASVCITINLALVIIWTVINICLSIAKIFFKFEAYWKINSVLYIIVGILSCFFTGSSHPVDVDLKSGYILRLTTILIFYLVGIAHLAISCKVIMNANKKTAKKSISNELIEQKVKESTDEDKVLE
jgi:hypothetical protein